MYFVLHFILVIIGIIFFLYEYFKQRKLYQLLLLIWVPFTLTRYLFTDKNALIVIGILQIILFFIALFFMFYKKKTSTKDNDIDATKDDSSIPKDETSDLKEDSSNDNN